MSTFRTALAEVKNDNDRDLIELFHTAWTESESAERIGCDSAPNAYRYQRAVQQPLDDLRGMLGDDGYEHARSLWSALWESIDSAEGCCEPNYERGMEVTL